MAMSIGFTSWSNRCINVKMDIMDKPQAASWHRRSPDEALAALRAARAGLSAAEASARLARDGPNA